MRSPPPPLCQAFIMPDAKLDCVDLFAGKAAISRSFRENGLTAGTLDIELDSRDVSWRYQFFLQGLTTIQVGLDNMSWIRVLIRDDRPTLWCFGDTIENILILGFGTACVKIYVQNLRPMRMPLTSQNLQDILTSLGFIRSLFAIMRASTGAVVTMGVVCSSWTTINRPYAAFEFDET